MRKEKFIKIYVRVIQQCRLVCEICSDVVKQDTNLQLCCFLATFSYFRVLSIISMK